MQHRNRRKWNLWPATNLAYHERKIASEWHGFMTLKNIKVFFISSVRFTSLLTSEVESKRQKNASISNQSILITWSTNQGWIYAPLKADHRPFNIIKSRLLAINSSSSIHPLRWRWLWFCPPSWVLCASAAKLLIFLLQSRHSRAGGHGKWNVLARARSIHP